MKFRAHKTGDEFQRDDTRSALVAAVFLIAILAAGLVLIVHGLK